MKEKNEPIGNADLKKGLKKESKAKKPAQTTNKIARESGQQEKN